MKKFIILTIFTILYGQDIAFVGNSITASGYDAIIDSILTEYTTYNFGVEGVTVSIPGFDYKSTQEFQDVLALTPQYVIVLLGANDRHIYSHQDIGRQNSWETKYRYLISSFIDISDNILLGLLPYQLYSNENTTIDDMNDRIRSVAQDYGLEIIDFNLALGTNPDYFLPDGVHPNVTGKRIMASEVLKYFDVNLLGVEDDYWKAVEDYERQKRTGWFGCQE